MDIIEIKVNNSIRLIQLIKNTLGIKFDSIKSMKEVYGNKIRIVTDENEIYILEVNKKITK